MLVVQICTTESGLCSTCFVTALYWNEDLLLDQPQKEHRFSNNLIPVQVEEIAAGMF